MENLYDHDFDKRNYEDSFNRLQNMITRDPVTSLIDGLHHHVRSHMLCLIQDNKTAGKNMMFCLPARFPIPPAPPLYCITCRISVSYHWPSIGLEFQEISSRSNGFQSGADGITWTIFQTRSCYHELLMLSPTIDRKYFERNSSRTIVRPPESDDGFDAHRRLSVSTCACYVKRC